MSALRERETVMDWLDRLRKRMALYNGRETYAFGMVLVGLSLTVLPGHDSPGGSIGYAENFWHLDRAVFAILSFLSAVVILIFRPVGLSYVVLASPLLLFVFTILKYSLDNGLTLVVFSLLLAYFWRIIQDTTKP